MINIVARNRYLFWSIRAQESFELLELDFSRAVLVDFSDEALDVNGHLELILNSVNQLLCIYASFSVLKSSHCNECVKEFCFIRALYFLDFTLEDYWFE